MIFWNCNVTREHRWNELWDPYTEEFVKVWPLFITSPRGFELTVTDTCGACRAKRIQTVDAITFKPKGGLRYEHC